MKNNIVSLSVGHSLFALVLGAVMVTFPNLAPVWYFLIAALAGIGAGLVAFVVHAYLEARDANIRADAEKIVGRSQRSRVVRLRRH